MESEKLIVEVNGGSLVVEEAGEGETLLFLHAGVADRRMWQPQTAVFSQNYHTIAYDRRGFGETTSADVAFSNVDDLRQLLDSLQIDEVSLIGCSQGGRVAIDFALTTPQRVRRLALLAPAVSGAPAPDSFPPQVEALDAEMDAADEAGDWQRINEIEAQLWLDGPGTPAGRVGGENRALFLDMNGIALQMPELEDELEPASAYERVGELALPVLLLWGDLDFPHVQERCRTLVETIPGARGAVIPGTAHLPNLEQPQRVNELLRTFFESST